MVGEGAQLKKLCSSAALLPPHPRLVTPFHANVGLPSCLESQNSHFMRILLLLVLFLQFSVCGLLAETKKIRVFVALADNASQGIVPVPAKIGDGDKPDDNLYWGCTDGLKSYFPKSAKWKVSKKENDVSAEVLRRYEFRHASKDVVLLAEAYRGSAIARCVAEFEAAVASGEYDLVAYIGHNGLMDFTLDSPSSPKSGNTAAIVLCCKSESYFRERLVFAKAIPLLLTDQFMFPGAFILHDAIEVWLVDGTVAQVRDAAGKAYAKNQKIALKAARGVFSNLEKE